MNAKECYKKLLTKETDKIAINCLDLDTAFGFILIPEKYKDDDMYMGSDSVYIVDKSEGNISVERSFGNKELKSRIKGKIDLSELGL